MAVTAPVLRAVGAKSTGTTGAVTVAAPSGIVVGDLEILVSGTIAGGSASITNDGGSAWTAVSVSPQDVTAGEKLYIWYRIRQSGDGDPQVTPGSDHSVSCRIAYQVNTFDPNAPIVIPIASNETTSDTSFSWAPGTSTTLDNSLVLVISTSGVDSNTAQVPVCTNSALTNLNSRANYETTSGGGGGFGITEGTLATHGAVGTFACTYVSASPKSYISFAISPASWQAIAGVSDVGTGSTSVASRAKTLDGAVAINDVIIINYTRAATSDDLASDTCTDSLGNTYVCQQHGYDSTDTQGYAVWTSIVTNAGTPTITITPPASHADQALQAQAYRYTAATGTPSIDTSAGDATPNTIGTTTTTTPSATPSIDGDLVVGCFNDSSDLHTFTAGAGFTQDQYSGVTIQGMSAIERKVLGTSTSGVGQTATATMSASGSRMMNAIILIKPPGGTLYTTTLSATGTSSAALTKTPSKVLTVQKGYDAFGRTVSAGSNDWGTSDSGTAWIGAETTGVAQVAGGLAQLVRSSSTSLHSQLYAYPHTDIDVRCKISLDTLPSADYAYEQVYLRYTDVDNNYRASLLIKADGSVAVHCSKTVATVNGTVIAATQIAAAGSYNVNDVWWLRAKISGTSISIKAWKVGTPEPATWSATAIDSGLASGSYTGIRSAVSVGTGTHTGTDSYDDFSINSLAVSVTRTPNKILTVTEISIISFARFASRALVATHGASVATKVLLPNKIFPIITQGPSAASLVRQPTKVLNATHGASVVILVRAPTKVLIATGVSIATFIRFASHILLATGVSAATKVISLVRAMPLIVSTSVPVLVKTPQRILTATHGSLVATLIRQPTKVLSAAAIGATSFVRAPLRTLSATGTGAASKLSQSTRILTATHGSAAVTLVRTPAKVFTVTVVSVVNFIRSAATTLKATAVSVAIKVLLPSRTLSTSGTGVATKVPTPNKVLTATHSSAVASLVHLPTKVLATTGVGVALLVRSAATTLRTTAVGVSTLVRSGPTHVLSATVSHVTTLVRAPARVFSVTATSIVTKVMILTRSFPLIVVTGVPALVRMPTKVLTSSGIGGASLAWMPGKVLSAVGIGSVTVMRAPTRALAMTAVAVPTFVRSAATTLSATAIGLATVNLLKVIIREFTTIGTAVVNSVRSPSTTLSAMGTGVTVQVVTGIHILSAGGNAVVSFVRSPLKIFTSTAVGVPVLTRAPSKVLSTAGTGIAALLRMPTKVLTAVATGVATVERVSSGASATFLAGATAVVSLTRAPLRTLMTTAVSVARIVRSAGITKSTTGVGVPKLISTPARYLSVAGTGIVNLVSTPTKRLLAVAVSNSSVGRVVSKMVRATAVTITSFRRIASHTFRTSTTGVVHLITVASNELLHVLRIVAAYSHYSVDAMKHWDYTATGKVVITRANQLWNWTARRHFDD